MVRLPDALKALIEEAALILFRHAMGRELMHTYPVYAESLLFAHDILTKYGCGWSLIGKYRYNQCCQNLTMMQRSFRKVRNHPFFAKLTWRSQFVPPFRWLVAVESNCDRPKKDDLAVAISDKCTSEVKSSAVYETLRKMGISYGPLFVGIDHLTTGPQNATGTFTVPDTAAVMPYHFESATVIHPVTLDLCFHFIWPTVNGTSLNPNVLYVPSSIKSIAISSQMKSPPGTKIKVIGTPNT